eukprot:5957912-Amphidinium_carterae.1
MTRLVDGKTFGAQCSARKSRRESRDVEVPTATLELSGRVCHMKWPVKLREAVCGEAADFDAVEAHVMLCAQYDGLQPFVVLDRRSGQLGCKGKFLQAPLQRVSAESTFYDSLASAPAPTHLMRLSDKFVGTLHPEDACALLEGNVAHIWKEVA